MGTVIILWVAILIGGTVPQKEEWIKARLKACAESKGMWSLESGAESNIILCRKFVEEVDDGRAAKRIV